MIAYLILFAYSVVAFVYYQKAMKLKHASKCPEHVEQRAYEIMKNSSYLMLTVVSFLWLPSLFFYLLTHLVAPQNPQNPQKPKDKGEE